MLDGTYAIEFDTPLGRKSGTVDIRVSGASARIGVDAPIIGKQHIDGRVEGDSLLAEGAFRLKLVGKVTYSLQGMVDGDALRISIRSSKGDLDLLGSRI